MPVIDVHTHLGRCRVFDLGGAAREIFELDV